jgi:prepilin peptidase CpaA
VNRVQLLHLAPLLAMLLLAAIGDLRERKIRNWLTVAIMLTGLARSFTPAHSVAPGGAGLGLLVGFGLMFVLFAMGAVGGGDVKLLAGVGAWLGPAPTLCVFAVEAIIGMLIVLVQAAWQRRLSDLFHNSMLLVVNVAHVKELGIEHVTATGQSTRSVDRPLPYAVPVFLAVALMAIQSYITHGS